MPKWATSNLSLDSSGKVWLRNQSTVHVAAYLFPVSPISPAIFNSYVCVYGTFFSPNWKFWHMHVFDYLHI